MKKRGSAAAELKTSITSRGGLSGIAQEIVRHRRLGLARGAQQAVGAAAAVAGFFAAQAVEETALRTAFAVFIILAGLKDLFAKGVDKE